MQHLLPGTTLQGDKYKIERVLGQGGFGITYLAIQSGLERKVAIKEFFMKELCERDESTSHVTLGTSGSAETVARFREKFLKEARNIARLDHPNIVSVIDVFEENGTAYYVMKYAENGSLSDKVKREGYLTEPMATRYILHVASALEYIHQQKMNHLDIKPANIMLNEKDEAVLIDFGLSKQYDAVTGNQTSTTPVGISHGYAPMEQYREGGVGEFSPETDIYALGATFFKLLTGAPPPSASDVNEDGVPIDELKAKGVSQKAIDVICKAMEGRKKDRMKEVSTFIANLKGADQTTSHTSAPAPTPVIQEEDEATLIQIDNSKKEEERMHKEAAAKATKAKAETEARAKAEAECKAREAEDRKKKEEEEAHKATKQLGSKSKWMIGAVFAVFGLIILWLVNSNVTSNSDTHDKSTETEKDIHPHGEFEYEKYVTDFEVEVMEMPALIQHYSYTGSVTWSESLQKYLPNGNGRAVIFSEGESYMAVYVGNFVSGVFHGENGQLSFPNGASYKGSFVNGWYNKGTFYSDNGEYFVGTFRNGQPNSGSWYSKTGQFIESL